MTEELTVAKLPLLGPPFALERHLRDKNAPSHHYFASYKRHITHRWCSRLTAGGLPGSELAVEYLYGKYIKNLSAHSIKESGRISNNFLAFLRDREQHCTALLAKTSALMYNMDRTVAS